jgi:hypothetical protein
MKLQLKTFFLPLLALAILATSCRKEEVVFEQAPEEETLVAGSVVANLMQRTAMNDGSNDNIIDNANCFNIELPVTVIANGQELVINTTDDYEAIEIIFDDSDDDIDTLEIIFPITIIFSDFSQTTINNISELQNFANDCNGENQYDDDIECLDFQYPITASFFNTNNEIINTVTFTNDFMLFDFIDEIDEDDLITIGFPITVVLQDNTEITISNFTELETTINAYAESCDEDDDNDYNDDDCDNCSPVELVNILTSCNSWIVDKLERNDNDYDDLYDGYTFQFYEEGTVYAYYLGTTYNGTWSTNGSENDITVTINITGLPYCNNDWVLHEIQQYSGETKVDLRVGGEDRLRYESTCN